MTHNLWVIYKQNALIWILKSAKNFDIWENRIFWHSKNWRFSTIWKNDFWILGKMAIFDILEISVFWQFGKWQFSPTREYFRRFIWLKVFKIVKTRHFSKLPIKCRFRRKSPNKKLPKFLHRQNSPISSRPEMSFLIWQKDSKNPFMCHRYESYKSYCLYYKTHTHDRIWLIYHDS